MQCDTLAHVPKDIIVEGFDDLTIMGLPYSKEYGGVIRNGSICDKYFCFQADRYPHCINPRLVLCDFDQSTMVANNPRYIPIETNTWGWMVEWLVRVPYPKYHQEDPRLYYDQDGDLAMYFGDGFKVYQCKLHVTDNDVTACDVQIVTNDWMPTRDGRVKNYAPIAGTNEYIYQINPFMSGDKYFGWYDLSHWESKYGTPRGGTPCVPYRDEHLSFFHSSSEVKGVKHYYMGAFTFDDNGLCRFSRYPLVAPVAMKPVPENDGTIKQNPCGSVQVVFPAGVTVAQDGWYVSYGYNDTSTKMVFISMQQLEHNLVTIQKAVLPCCQNEALMAVH